MKSAVIVGASGVIGNELLANLRKRGCPVTGTYSAHPEEGLVHFDMRQQSIASVFPDLGGEDVVYVLSAHSNPSWVFSHQEEARLLNVTATRALIDELRARGTRVVFMSSVEVFDGKGGAYAESARPNPLNLYGKMKAEIEDHLRSAGGNFCIVRTCWNVGWSTRGRCVVELTYRTLARPGARMAHDNCFSLIDARDTAEGLARLGLRADITTCHLSGSEAIYRASLADQIIASSKFGREMRYERVPFSEIPYSEPRGRDNRLDNALARRELAMSFRGAREIIEEKVKLLDSWVEQGKIRF